MKVLNSFLTAFLMYSRIPVPVPEWRDENRKYALCFFPLVGAVTGVLLFGLWLLCDIFDTGRTLYAAAAVFIPVVVTGGIHLDGYMDVHDAKACMGDRSKKLEVMKDSRVGAFAVIHLVTYFIFQFGMFCQVKSERQAAAISFIFVISRAFSSLAAVTFKNARKNGTLQDFSEPAPPKVTAIAELAIIIFSLVMMIYIDGITGICAGVGSLLAFIYYRIFSYREFGGITGDLEGYFLQICELASLSFAIFGNAIVA